MKFFLFRKRRRFEYLYTQTEKERPKRLQETIVPTISVASPLDAGLDTYWEPEKENLQGLQEIIMAVTLSPSLVC